MPVFSIPLRLKGRAHVDFEKASGVCLILFLKRAGYLLVKEAIAQLDASIFLVQLYTASVPK